MRRALVLGVSVVTLSVSLAAGIDLATSHGKVGPVTLPTLVDRVREALADGYYQAVPQQVLAMNSVPEMIAALHDPYTAYLGAGQYKLLQRETASSYTGIGVGVLPSPHGLEVVSLHPGPAESAGVELGDMIVAVGGKSIAHVGAAQVLARITGQAGSRVSIELRRGDRDIVLTMKRAIVSAPRVSGRLLSFAGKKWGDVRLSTFNFGAAPVVAHMVKRLEGAGAAGFVLDLRDNPGGLFNQAVGVASLFLNHGIIVSLNGAHHPLQVIRAKPGSITTLPIVVLVNRYSASSSEIVAAALGDNRRATLVGERTFGKALVQEVDPLGNGDALELTVAHYYTPLGEDISSTGVTPEIHAVDDPRTKTDEALTAALRTLAQPAG